MSVGINVKNEADIAAQFALEAPISEISSYGSGNVNDTYLVCTTQASSADKATSDVDKRYILQRINQHVFRQPHLISLNLRCLTNHVAQNVAPQTEHAAREWSFPEIMSARDGNDYVIDGTGEFWRCQRFVENAVTYPEIIDEAHAQEAGYALGRFHQIVSDIDPGLLHDTLVGFHVTPRYVEGYDVALQTTTRDLARGSVEHGVDFVAARRKWASVLEDATKNGDLTQRAIHGDPKIDNILINTTTQKAVSIIDLDTFKPGLIQYDIGDCLRSCCNELGEETEQFEQVKFNVDLCRTILAGYLPIVREFFTEADYAYIYDSIRLIAFELGLRFFTDYLNGNVYFKVEEDEQNLRRALVQFKLAESIEAQERHIQRIVEELR